MKRSEIFWLSLQSYFNHRLFLLDFIEVFKWFSRYICLLVYCLLLTDYFGWDLSSSIESTSLLKAIVLEIQSPPVNLFRSCYVPVIASNRSGVFKLSLYRFTLRIDRYSFSVDQASRLIIVKPDWWNVALFHLLLSQNGLAAIAADLVEMIRTFTDDHYFSVDFLWIMG